MKRKFFLALYLLKFASLEIYSSAYVTDSQKCPIQCICDMRNNLRRASCSNQNIVDVNVGVSQDVQIYILSGNVINDVDNYVFRELKYTSLVQLDLSNNSIFWIGLHAFADLDKLRILNLSTNRLQRLPSDLFWYNKALESLDLSGNQFNHFENVPFLEHSNLKVLNLSNSHIVFIPAIAFTQLPRLEVLDLSNNYMIELKLYVLIPLVHIKKLNLKDNPWHCNDNFYKLEHLILSRIINYVKQCHSIGGKKPQMFERMIAETDAPRDVKEVDLSEVWKMDNIDITTSRITTVTNSNTSLNFYDRFEKRLSSVWALVIGFQVGLILGIVCTYFWLANLCKCRRVACNSPRTRRQLRRARNVDEMETATSLLWTSVMSANTDTPPIARRQLSSSNCGAYCRSSSWEILPSINGNDNTFRIHNTRDSQVAVRAETPPPPYQQCTNDNINDCS